MRVEGAPLSGAWEAGLGVSKEVHPQFGAGLPGAGGLWESRLSGVGGMRLDGGGQQSCWGPR